MGSFPTETAPAPVAGTIETANRGSAPSFPLSVDIETAGAPDPGPSGELPSPRVEIRDGSRITALSDRGAVGDVRIVAGSPSRPGDIEIRGDETVVESLASSAEGPEIGLHAAEVRVADGATIASTSGIRRTPGGAIRVTGGDLTVAGGAILAQSGLDRFTEGGGGDIDVDVSGAVRVTAGSDGDGAPLPGTIQSQRGAQVPRGDTTDLDGGDVRIRATSVAVEGGLILSETEGTRGGDIDVGATEQVRVAAMAPEGDPDGAPIFGQILSLARERAREPGGNIRVEAGSIEVDSSVENGVELPGEPTPARIASVTTSQNAGATGGSVTLIASEIDLLGGGGVFAVTGPGSDPMLGGAADAGDIAIFGAQNEDGSREPAERVTVSGFEFLGTVDTPEGPRARDVRSGIFADSQQVGEADQGTSGDAGSILIEARIVEVLDGGQVAADSQDTGRAGDLTIRASEVLVEGSADGLDSALRVRSGNFVPSSDDEPRGGNLLIEAETVELSSVGIASAAVQGKADGGTVTVDADEIEIAGRGSGLFASVLATSEALGDGGSVVVKVGDRLVVRDGGQIRVAQPGADQGLGLPGNVRIDGMGSGSVEIVDGGSVNASLVSPRTPGPEDEFGSVIVENIDTLTLDSGGEITADTEGTGPGGSIRIDADSVVSLSGGSRISAASRGDATGNAGPIEIDAGREIILTGGSSIETEATQAAGGTIRLSASERIFLEDSRIVTSVQESGEGDGGDIGIPELPGAEAGSGMAGLDPPGVRPTPALAVLNRSLIAANAVEGNGGNIQINAAEFVISDDSAITATSQRGVDGNIQVNAPDSNLAGQAVPLSTNYFDATELMLPPCAARGARSGSFVIQRRAAPAPPPDAPLSLALLSPATEGQQCPL